MPSKSKAQHNLMQAVAHNAAFAKKVGIPQSVGRDFSSADKGKKFSKGGAAERQAINQPKTNHGEQALFKKGGIMKKMTKGGDTTGMSANKQSKGITKETMGKVRTAAPSKDGIAEKGKTKGMMPKMGGNTIGNGPMVNTGMKRGGMAKKK
jgi:hypothetical protein